MDVTAAREAFERGLAMNPPVFGSFFLIGLLGLDIQYPDGKCVLTFPLNDFLFNPHGALHGGIVASVLDIASGHLLHNTGTHNVTLELKVQYLEALKIGPARCEASLLRGGRNINFVEARLFDGAGKLAAIATSTWKSVLPS